MNSQRDSMPVAFSLSLWTDMDVPVPRGFAPVKLRVAKTFAKRSSNLTACDVKRKEPRLRRLHTRSQSNSLALFPLPTGDSFTRVKQNQICDQWLVTPQSLHSNRHLFVHKNLKFILNYTQTGTHNHLEHNYELLAVESPSSAQVLTVTRQVL